MERLPTHVLDGIQRISVRRLGLLGRAISLIKPYTLITYAASMPALTSVDIGHLAWDRYPPQLLRALPITLRELNICSGRSRGSVVAMAGALRRLTNLECLSCPGLRRPHEMVPFDALPRLCRFSCSMGRDLDRSALVAAIGASPCRTSLQMLRLSATDVVDAGARWWQNLGDLTALSEVTFNFPGEVESLSESDMDDFVAVLTDRLALTVVDVDLPDLARMAALVTGLTSAKALFLTGHLWKIQKYIECLPEALEHVFFHASSTTGFQTRRQSRPV